MMSILRDLSVVFLLSVLHCIPFPSFLYPSPLSSLSLPPSLPLPEGSHTLSKTVVTSSGGFGMMAKFTKKKSTCIGCRAVLEKESKLCLYSLDLQIMTKWMHA